MRQMLICFAAGLMEVFERRTGEFELTARFNGDRTTAVIVGKADDLSGIFNAFPAEQLFHALQDGLDTICALIRDRR